VWCLGIFVWVLGFVFFVLDSSHVSRLTNTFSRLAAHTSPTFLTFLCFCFFATFCLFFHHDQLSMTSIATNESRAAYHTLEDRNEYPTVFYKTSPTLSNMSNNNNDDGGGVFLPVLQAEATATGGATTTATADEEPLDDISHSNPPPRTTAKQSFIHLLKGYVGPGCLSLPWALSQLGVGLGSVVIFVVAYWTSYNIWVCMFDHQRIWKGEVLLLTYYL
jgi:hypothetical protein